MTSLGVMLLVASATTGFDLGDAGVGGIHLFRHSAVANGPAPPGGMIKPGMGGPGGPQAGRRFPNVKSQIVFFGPGGPSGTGDMKIGWQTGGPNGEKMYLPGRSTPFRYNFMQGYIYRLKLSDISGRPTLNLYPTIEVAPATPATDAYLTHNQIPVQFTAEDLDQVEGGNFVTKVIYLPDPRYQELAVANVETLVSTRLEPGVDPVLEADKRGTILLIVRLGGINLEMDAVGSPVPSEVAPPTLPPGAYPPGAAPTAPVPSTPLDAPASGVTPVTPPTPTPAAEPTPAPATTPAPAPPVATPAPPPPVPDPNN
jgi:hypothetical protein